MYVDSRCLLLDKLILFVAVLVILHTVNVQVITDKKLDKIKAHVYKVIMMASVKHPM